jgi:uncharacterized protein YqgV (UPF0045/DUF77 family)
MFNKIRKEVVATLSAVNTALQEASNRTNSRMSNVAHDFHDLALLAKKNLSLASEVVAGFDNDRLAMFPEKLEDFSDGMQAGLEARLTAVTRLLHVLTAIEGRFDELSQTLTHQRAVTAEFKALRVLTEVEVANLGDADADMQHLVEELTNFSENVSADTVRISEDTLYQRRAIQEAQQVFQGGMARMRQGLMQVRCDLVGCLPQIRGRISQLMEVPAQLRTGIENTTERIDGVIAAVQAHDITRQQIEHVHKALSILVDGLSHHQNALPQTSELSNLYGGLKIQVLQLQYVKEMADAWLTQIRECIVEIGQLSAADLADISRLVFDQEKYFSFQLARIEGLQQSCQLQADKMRQTLGRISGLLDVVNEHMRRSDWIRDNLQILVLNSIVSSMHMGPQGSVIASIAKLINRSSDKWNADIIESRKTLTGIAELVQEVNQLMAVFSLDNGSRLRTQQGETHAMLQTVGDGAARASTIAADIDKVARQMRLIIKNVERETEELEKGFGEFELVLLNLDGTMKRIEAYDPDIAEQVDPAKVEDLFSCLYTTQTERDVMRAALRGAPPPLAQQPLSGNDVELF